MGKQLSDLKINFVQRLLKQQFGLQDKPNNLTTSSLPNRIQIIHYQSHRHWIVATTQIMTLLKFMTPCSVTRIL